MHHLSLAVLLSLSKHVSFLHISKLTLHCKLFSTATFQLTYTLYHTRIFFEQVFHNIVSGFTPNTNNPDPNWGKCLQCAAIDRARSKASTAISRSPICTQCFKQYCYDPQDPPSKSVLPNRDLVFKDPDPQGLSKLSLFFDNNKFKFVGALIGLVVFIAALCVAV
jgi:lysophospholipase